MEADSTPWEDPEAQLGLLVRLGISNPSGGPGDWWRAAQAAGFSFLQFHALYTGSDAGFTALCNCLNSRARALECASEQYAPADDVFAALKCESIATGRPAGMLPSARRLKDLRERAHLKQEAIADACGVSLDTLQRAEAGRRISPSSLKRIADGFSRELKCLVTVEDLIEKNTANTAEAL